jgi:hypothetical protein
MSSRGANATGPKPWAEVPWMASAIINFPERLFPDIEV